jgi:hypothetical protein
VFVGQVYNIERVELQEEMADRCSRSDVHFRTANIALGHEGVGQADQDRVQALGEGLERGGEEGTIGPFERGEHS